MLAHEEARQEVSKYALAELFHETAFLPQPSLFELVWALLSESGLQTSTLGASCEEAPAPDVPVVNGVAAEESCKSASSVAEPSKPKAGGNIDVAAAIGLQLLAEVGLRNRDRFGLIWADMQPAFARALNPARPQVKIDEMSYSNP